MNELQKAAEILVECGVFSQCHEYPSGNYIGFFVKTSPTHKKLIKWSEKDKIEEIVECFSDTLEGRRQADAMEDWLQSSGIPNMKTWIQSGSISGVVRGNNQHQWRLDRIKWCLEELSK